MQELRLAAALLIVAGCASKTTITEGPPELTPGPVSIKRISATPEAIIVEVHASNRAKLALYELRPYEKTEDSAGRDPIWTGELEGGSIRIPRFNHDRDRLFSKYQLADPVSRDPLCEPHWVNDLSGLPARSFEFPWPESIKGLQVHDVEDAIALGVKYAGFNVMAQQIVDLSGRSGGETWKVDGVEIPINTGYIRGLDAAFKRMTDAGINVTAIMLNGVPPKPDPKNPFIHPRTNLAKAPFHLGAFNVTDERGILHLRAAMEYMANRYSDPSGRHGWVSGYIIGNEVQAHWEWYNIGRMPLDEFIEHYGVALRIADLAARKHHSGIRTYVSMEHHWNRAIRSDRLTAFRGKDFLERLNAWSKSGGDFPWHVAFHPYPENLFEPRTWNDRQVALSFETPKITFKNIEVLPAFLNRKHMLCGSKARRIILSEQGFHTPDGPDGEKTQAAAYAYAYYKLSHTDCIDAFILHRHVDHKKEGGLRLGLRRWKEDDPSPCTPGPKKTIYDVFRLADTDGQQEAFEFAKPVIGITDWKEVLPSEHIEATPDLVPALTIVEDGKSEYVIAIPDEPDAVVRYAAGELQHFLAEMSGAELPVVCEADAAGKPAFLIGRCRRHCPDSRLRELKEDGVLVRTEGNDVLLLGADARGQLYSVYALLERYLGVRFLARDCTHVEKRKSVTLPQIDYVHSPPFMYRETLYYDSFPREIATRQRLNGPTTKCGPDVGGRIVFFPYVHSFCMLVPPQKYFSEHPEYFSLVGGKRTNKKIHGQLCLTNPDVLEVATEQVLKWIEEHPEAQIIDVSQNDGGGACECEKCRAMVEQEGSQHGPILRFVNAIADRVREEHPDKWIETLAYAYSTKPPALTKPRDNVIIRLCHAGCYFHGFERCGLGANHAKFIAEWSKLTRRIFIWHYATNFAHYLAPNQNLDGLARDIKYYAANGVNGLMVQGDYQSPGGELAELRQYLASQLMWNPERDPGMIRLEFCNGYYGRAANRVLDYLALMDKLAARPDLHAFGAWDPKTTVPPDFLSDGLEILSKARADADSDEAANRVEKLLLPLWYMQLVYPRHYGLSDKGAAQVLADFKRVVRRNKVTHVREGGENMKSWIAEMEARYGSVPETLVYDLYLNLRQAKTENCLDWRTDTIKKDGAALLTIFHHPPAKGDGDATYEIELPALKENERLSLVFATGFTGPTRDGVRFAVLVNGEEVWTHTQKTLPPINNKLDLTRWAGSRIKLTLRVNALGNETHDWANWVRPQILVEK